MSSSLHDQVISALDSQPEKFGVIVCKKDGTMLADREPLPGAACVLLCIDAEPFRFSQPERKGAPVATWHVIEGGPAHRAASSREAGG